jgi:hypothetical protein
VSNRAVFFGDLTLVDIERVVHGGAVTMTLPWLSSLGMVEPTQRNYIVS